MKSGLSYDRYLLLFFQQSLSVVLRTDTNKVAKAATRKYRILTVNTSHRNRLSTDIDCAFYFHRATPRKRRTNGWFLFHNNAPTHRLVLVKYFLTKSIVTTLEHPLYSPDMDTLDFYLLPWLKGRHICAATEIIKNATEELKSLSQNGFQECFQQLYSRWQKCIVARGD